jgi:hypothetical protein
MLELIVLGRIPGTSFQITFDWAIFLAGLFLLALELQLLRRHYPIKLPSNWSQNKEAASVQTSGDNTLPVQLQLFE